MKLQHMIARMFFIFLTLSIASTQAVAEEPAPLVFGIISSAEPSRVYAQWQSFADYVGEKTGRRVKIVVPRGFDKLAEIIDQGQVDIFYVNSLVYYRLKDKNKAVPLAQMQNNSGAVSTRSVVFVRGDSGVTKLEQLKGEKVAFLSPLASGGYLAPRALFYNEGIQKEAIQEEFTQNLSSSIHKVLLGEVKAGTMCGLTYKLMSEKVDTGELAIIASSEEFAEDVIGARPGLPADMQKIIGTALLDMDQNETGRKVIATLRDMKVQKFIAYDAAKTETITRRLLDQAKM
jgi:phosphonate transport system substrate-binding protein